MKKHITDNYLGSLVSASVFLIVFSFITPVFADGIVSDNFDTFNSSGWSDIGGNLPVLATSGCFLGDCVVSPGGNSRFDMYITGSPQSEGAQTWYVKTTYGGGGSNNFFVFLMTGGSFPGTNILPIELEYSNQCWNGTGWHQLGLQWEQGTSTLQYKLYSDCAGGWGDWGDSGVPNFTPDEFGFYNDGFTSNSTYLDELAATSTSNACTPGVDSDCNSNVMFLPGIEGSNLYAPNALISGVEEQIWLPNVPFGGDTQYLDMTNPLYANDVYTKEKDIVGTAYPLLGGPDIYTSFINQMDALKTAGTIVDWEPIAYDWRLDYQQLLDNGNETSDGKIYYRGSSAATSTPYIIQELKKLASTSRTGKVTIVAHSNGGLLAKALLMQPGMSQYVDKVIMVATPQLGTPQAVAGILNGTNAGLPSLANEFMGNADARYLAQSMPTTYNFLPSAQYFSDVFDGFNPVVAFDSTTMPWLVAKYGSFITSTSSLKAFMTDASRPTPAYDDLNTPVVASSTLFDNAVDVHSSLDNWTSPSGVQLITIAGWGDPTLSTLWYTKDYQITCTSLGPCPTQSVVALATTTAVTMAIDGDGTVVDASANWSTNSTSTKYWINLLAYNQATSTSITHANIFTAAPVLNLLETLLTNGSTSTLPTYATTSRPTYTGTDPRVYYIAHSPVTLGFTDSSGNYTGSTASTTVFDVPDVYYERFGEIQFLSIPAASTGQVTMIGTGSGSMALDVQSVDGDTYLASTTFAAVPVATGTVATVDVSPSISPTASSTLNVDEDGDGITDLTLHASQDAVVLPSPSTPTFDFTLTNDGDKTIGAGLSTSANFSATPTEETGGTLVQDTFTGTDGTALTDHTSDTGAGWSFDCCATSTLADNKIEGAPWAYSIMYNTFTPDSPDYSVSMDINWNGPLLSAEDLNGDTLSMGVAGRVVANLDRYTAFYDMGSQEWKLSARVYNDETTIGTSSEPYVQGETHNVKLSMLGSAITVYVDGVSVISVTDTTLTNAGSPGFVVSNLGDPTEMIGDNYLVTGGAAAPAVTFTATGLPTGATASTTPGSCSPTCSGTVTITTASTTPTGVYPITVTGTSGTLVHTSSFNLTITPAPDTIGETSVLSTTDSGDGNLLIVQDAPLTQTATLQTLSLNVINPVGQLRLGIYDATGPNGGPGNLEAQTDAFTPVAGWNSQPVITPVQLPAGNYWLAYLLSSNSFSFPADFGIGTFDYAYFPFDVMPSTFPAIDGNGIGNWSLYGTLTQ